MSLFDSAIKVIAVFVLVVSIFNASGCNNSDVRTLEVYPVDGQLFFQQKPAAGAMVTFHPTDTTGGATAITCKVRDDGRVVPVQPDGAIGLPVGGYVVTAHWTVDGVDQLAGKYADESKPLTKIEVKSTVNILAPIRLK